ncbi:MAG: elongation factor G, partial [Clostridia bacterium]|nr:elongation factor G [Clostridia bacterium]
MKVYQTDEIRNIALVGGAKAGKTTLAECMIFEGGLINRRGSVDDKNTVSDYREIEHERQNSVSSTVLYAEFGGKKINIIDTPGFDDFVGEVISALKVADTGVMVINAQNGVEVGAEISWRYTSRNHTPVIFAINHLEHEKSNFDETIRQLKSQFGGNVTICQYPVNPGLGFNQVIDLLKMKLYKFPDEGGAPQELEIPDSEKERAEELQAELVEKAAESEEALMEIFFENGTLTEEEMIKGIKKGLVSRGMFPVFCINAKHNMGVSRLMEFINNSAPAPNEMPPVKTTKGKELKCDPKEPVSLFVFKTVIESHLGEVSFFKVCNGELNEGTDMINANNDNKERLSQLFIMAGRKTREKIAKISSGDIGATIKLKNTATNETLNISKNANDIIEPIEFPDPKMTMAIKSANSADDEKLNAILNEIHKVDKTFTIKYSKELRQLIAGGMGELHLNLIKWTVENLEKIPFEYVTPRIAYRETITKSAKATYRHKKQSGGSGQFGEVHMMIEPYTEGMTFT